MNIRQKLLTIFIVVFSINNNLKAQSNLIDSTKAKVNLNISADVMSRYIWRGADYGNSPCIQPTLSLGYKNFELGSWSALSTSNTYKEIDLYAKYTLKNFSLLLYDYYIPEANGFPSSPDVRYFVVDDKKTAHSLEGSITYKGGENFPIWILVGTYFYGNDKRWGYDIKKDTNETTYYSSYAEMGYNFKFGEQSLDAFVGFTPQAGAYGSEIGVVNCGFTAYRNIKLTEHFTLPIKGSLIFNPQTSNVFFAFGFTL